MRQILDTEDHVQIPPLVYSDPFSRIIYLIKEEIRKYKWMEGEKGRKLSWERARQEWTDAYREKFEKFLIDTLYFSDATSQAQLFLSFDPWYQANISRSEYGLQCANRDK